MGSIVGILGFGDSEGFGGVGELDGEVESRRCRSDWDGCMGGI